MIGRGLLPAGWHGLGQLMRNAARNPIRNAARSLFIQTEATPNENALKFKPGKMVVDTAKNAGGGVEFTSRQHAVLRSPLADALLQIEGVESVFFGGDFVSVNKKDGSLWIHLKPQIFGVLMEHFTADRPVLLDRPATDASAAPSDGEEWAETDREIVQMIKELLDVRIRPVIQNDGGDVQFRGYKDGWVRLKLQGACRSCSSSVVTLRNGIENMLMHYIPDVKGVEQISDPIDQLSQSHFEHVEKNKPRE